MSEVKIRTCHRHQGIDSDGDDQCNQYATAAPTMQKLMGLCRFDYRNPVASGGALDPREIMDAVNYGHKEGYSRATDLADFIEGEPRVIGGMGIGPTGDVSEVARYLKSIGGCAPFREVCMAHQQSYLVDVGICRVGRFMEWSAEAPTRGLDMVRSSEDE